LASAEAAWFVRQEVNQAKADGKLPDDFVAEELPPEGATPPQATEPTVPFQQGGWENQPGEVERGM